MNKEIIISSRYKVIKKVGEGGMAKVYMAYDLESEKNVALKILKKENINEKKIKNFKKEASTLSLMDDDNIVKIYDIGEEDNIHYIVAEYIEGMTLKEYINSCSPIPVEEVIEITKQVVKGIIHAHEKNVVHKDIKSQNILLDENKNVKITDFGISDIMDEDITRTQSLMGTPQYIAPEILNRDVLTEQSDLYSIGILMYEMLIGQAPFVGDKPAVIMMKQMNHPLPSIIAQRHDVPQSLENIVILATAKKLENRYKNASEILVDLNEVFDEKNQNNEKIVLENDILENDNIEKTIIIDEVKNNNKKKYIVFAVVAVIILLGSLFFLKPHGLSMPDVVNKSIDQAKNELVLLGINESNIHVKYENNINYENDKIISTDPPADKKITKDEKIIILASSGPEQLILKDYKNSIGNTVMENLKLEGYNVVLNVVESDIKEGLIVSQEPVAGSKIEKGSTITLNVSSGSLNILVPNFNNLNKDEAENWALQNNIQISITYLCTNEYEKNKVFKQSLPFNSNVKKAGSLSITVSDGPCNEPEQPSKDKEEVSNE